MSDCLLGELQFVGVCFAQCDIDQNGIGDCCEHELQIARDDDYYTGDEDNCEFHTNHDQANRDKDSQGDACDTDDDGDGILDTNDICPLVKGSYNNFTLYHSYQRRIIPVD